MLVVAEEDVVGSSVVPLLLLLFQGALLRFDPQRLETQIYGCHLGYGLGFLVDKLHVSVLFVALRRQDGQLFSSSFPFLAISVAISCTAEENVPTKASCLLVVVVYSSDDAVPVRI